MIKAIAFDVSSTLTKNIFWLNKDVFDLAIHLKEKYQVGILSNVNKLFSKLPVNQYIYSNFNKNLVILSFEAKSKKPEKEIYEIFVKRTGFTAKECLLIDNRKTNIVSSKKNGMKGIVFVTLEQLIQQLAKIGIEQSFRPVAQN